MRTASRRRRGQFGFSVQLPVAEIRQRFAGLPRAQLDLLLAVRSALLELIPGCNEFFKWDALSYQKEEPDGAIKGGICQLRPRGTGVELGFVHGAFLPDPQRRLAGSGKYKRVLPVGSVDEIRAPAVVDLIRAADRFDPAGLSLSPGIPGVVKKPRRNRS